MKKQNNSSGFTLVEIIIALVIFSVGILSVYKLFVNNLFVMDKLLSYYETHSIAEGIMNKSVFNFNTNSSSNTDKIIAGRFGKYKWNRTIRKENLLDITAIYKITVTVENIKYPDNKYKLIYYHSAG